jgi:hypothetical protein
MSFEKLFIEVNFRKKGPNSNKMCKNCLQSNELVNIFHHFMAPEEFVVVNIMACLILELFYCFMCFA